MDEGKETTCAPTRNCVNKKLEVNTANENECVLAGWQCKYTETVVECCGDPDCAGLTCAGTSYGPRVKKCDLVDGSPTKYTCQCVPCRKDYPEDCANSCCDAKVKGTETGNCVPDGVPLPYKYNSTWLCASASPVNWHECDANSLGKTINSGRAYVCMAQEDAFVWVEITPLKDVMIMLSFVFVFALVFRKKFNLRLLSQSRH